MIISKADPCSGMQPSFSQAHDDLLKGHFRFPQPQMYCQCSTCATQFTRILPLPVRRPSMHVVHSRHRWELQLLPAPPLPEPLIPTLYPRLPPSSSIQSERHLALRSPFPYVWCSRNRVSRVRGVQRHSDTAGAGKTGL